MKKTVFFVFVISLCTIKSFGQWSPPSTKTDFITTTHNNSTQNYGLNLESSGGGYRYIIHNNLSGTNQQAFYIGQANSAKNIFGISSSTDSGSTWFPRFTINQNGNVGFNTDTPSTNFQVNGQVRLNPGLNNNNYVSFRSNTSSQMNMIFYSQNSAKWNFYTSSDDKFYFRKTDNNTGGGVKMTFDGDNVGIGTDSPSERLDVAGKIQADHLIRVNAATSTEGGELALDGPSGYNDWRIDNRLGNFRLHHSGTVYFQLGSNGNLGLGTTTTGTHKLAVEGSIGAREIKVEASGWSDFVFRNDYKLPSLSEVEDFIGERGHLPEIPSEAEIMEKGINLGEMDSKLLQKIEELMLYTIQQQKEIEILKNEIKSLKKG
nr:hypothetical protein [uncultured Allomuricauda sp.]